MAFDASYFRKEKIGNHSDEMVSFVRENYCWRPTLCSRAANVFLYLKPSQLLIQDLEEMRVYYLDEAHPTSLARTASGKGANS